MKSIIFFIKKEAEENCYNYKLLIVLVIFVLIGIGSPLMAKALPLIMETIESQNIVVTVAEPKAIDAWMQYFKLINQGGIILLVILFIGTVSGEVEKGTLINLLTKGMKRPAVVLSKFVFILLIWTIAFLISLVCINYYTNLYWPVSEVSNEILLKVICMQWFFGLFVISLMVLGSTLFRSIYYSILFLAFCLLLLYGMNIFETIKGLNPINLSTIYMPALMGTGQPTNYVTLIVSTVLFSILALFFSIMVFNKKQL